MRRLANVHADVPPEIKLPVPLLLGQMDCDKVTEGKLKYLLKINLSSSDHLVGCRGRALHVRNSIAAINGVEDCPVPMF